MAEQKYPRDLQRMDCLGIDVNRPVDSAKPNRFAWLQNMRTTKNGTIQPRKGLTQIATIAGGFTPAHSIRRLNDTANNTWTLIQGVGTHLFYGQASATDADSGYSGDPLALQPWRPKDSPTPFMYVADRSRMRKLGVSGSLQTVGLPQVTGVPGVAPAQPFYKDVDTFQATTGWAQAGTAGAPTLISAGPGYRTTTTIAQIIYDVSTTGWASISPTSAAGIGPGERLIFNPGGGSQETVTVQMLYPNTLSTTIGSISYDSGTTGACSLVLATPVDNVFADVIIRNTTLSENARIVAVTIGPQNTTSIRIVTTGTWAATNAVQILATFRGYTTVNHAAAETIRVDGVRTAVTTGTGTLTKTSALDLSLITTGLATQPDDLMHISFRVSDPTVITELKLQLDVDIATNDFTRNYYWRSFRPSDLTLGAANLESLLASKQAAIQKAIIDATPVATNEPFTILTALQNPNFYLTSPEEKLALQQDAADTASQQFNPGANVWVELTFPISSLTRVGSDLSRTLQNVAALRLVFLVTGNVTIDMDCWWIGGGYGPNTYENTSSPYFYRYRARHAATNVASNWGPATRYPATPQRQQLTVTPTQYAAPSGTSFATGDFVLDLQRFGGENPDWHYVGTVPNASSPSFADIYDDTTVAGQPIIGQINYQPWPIVGAPVTGTTGTVAGTTVNDSSTTFSTSWAPGTRILVNNQPYTIRNVISTSKLEILENAGTQSSVVWRIDAPVILAQPLPVLWEEGDNLFGLGDSVNPGRLYYSNPATETTQTTNYLDLTPPSEPLQQGVQFNVRSWVWSSDNFMQILRTGNADAPFLHQQVPNGKGMYNRWAYTREPGPFLAFLGRDGIYVTQGGEPLSLTDADLYPLFPNEGNLGTQIVQSVSPAAVVEAPDMVVGNITKLRLAYYDEFLYFDYAYVGGSDARRTLVMAFDAGAYSRGESPGGWFYDKYTPSIGMHYGEEGAGVHALILGGIDGQFYRYAGVDDDQVGIECGLLTQSRDQGDARARKLYGDVMLDVDTDDVSLTVTPLINNNQTALTATVVLNTIRTQVPIPCETPWTSARNISIIIGFTVGGVVSITSACPEDSGFLTIPYSYQFTATGGTPPYTWSVSDGELPDGITLNASTGEISGTPTETGTFTFEITVTDSTSPTPLTDTIECEVLIHEPLEITVECPEEQPEVDVPYSYQLDASGGVEPYTWTLVAGSFPDGITLNSSTGEISGTATEGGEFEWTVRVTDSEGTTAEIECEFNILVCFVEEYPTEYLIGCRGASGGAPGVWEITAWTDGVTSTDEDYNEANVNRAYWWDHLWTGADNGLGGTATPGAVIDGDPDTFSEGRMPAHSAIFEYRKLILTDFPGPDPDRTLVSVDFVLDSEVDMNGGNGNFTYACDVWNTACSEVYCLNDGFPASVGQVLGVNVSADRARQEDTLTIPGGSFTGVTGLYARIFGWSSGSDAFTQSASIKAYGFKIRYNYCEEE